MVILVASRQNKPASFKGLVALGVSDRVVFRFAWRFTWSPITAVPLTKRFIKSNFTIVSFFPAASSMAFDHMVVGPCARDGLPR